MSRMLIPGTELETCYDDEVGENDVDDDHVPGPVWPGTEHWSHRNNGHKSREEDNRNRCFAIRHQPSQFAEETRRTVTKNMRSEKLLKKSCEDQSGGVTRDHRKQYSHDNTSESRRTQYCDNNNVELDSLDESDDDDDDVTEKRREDMDRVIAELTSALIQSKGVSALTAAVNKNNDTIEKKHDHAAPVMKKTNNHNNTKHLQISRNDQRSHHQHVKTESQKHYYLPKRKPKILLKQRCYDNTAYSSEDTTDTNVSRDKDPRYLRHHHRGSDILHPAFLPPLPQLGSRNYQNYFHDRNISVPHSGSWHLAKRSRRPAALHGELDYKNYNFNVGMFLTEELYRANLYSSSKDCARKKQRRKCFRSFCKFFCFFILFVSFILVIVCVSVFIIKDKYNE